MNCIEWQQKKKRRKSYKWIIFYQKKDNKKARNGDSQVDAIVIEGACFLFFKRTDALSVNSIKSVIVTMTHTDKANHRWDLCHGWMWRRIKQKPQMLNFMTKILISIVPFAMKSGYESQKFHNSCLVSFSMCVAVFFCCWNIHIENPQIMRISK